MSTLRDRGPREASPAPTATDQPTPENVRAMFSALGWGTSTRSESKPAETVREIQARTLASMPQEVLDKADRAAPRNPSALPAEISSPAPYNRVTGAQYLGKNVGRLLEAEIRGDYGAGGWAGFRQWIDHGRVVRKGEKSTAIVTVFVNKGNYPLTTEAIGTRI